MKNKKPNAELVWKQLEDQLAPRLRLSVIDRTVYAHLLRHSRLEGKLRLHFSIMWLARNIRLSTGPVREGVRRLVTHGALRLIQRSKAGHVVEVRLPDEIRAMRLNRIERRAAAKEESAHTRAPLNFERLDFMSSKPLRNSIHARERGQCFYCLRRTSSTVHCLDHVVPRSRSGPNSYRNLVSSCMECNVAKGEKPADDFLRCLYRERRLTAAELAARLRALDALASLSFIPMAFLSPRGAPSPVSLGPIDASAPPS
ncbi:MAG: HNH endonuclease signature motif containing protein [Candidatus Acidiferrum sp.]